MSGTDTTLAKHVFASDSKTVVAAALGFALVGFDVTRTGPMSRAEQRLLGPPPGDAGRWQTMTKLGGRPALAGMTLTAAALAKASGRSPWRPVLAVGTGAGVRWALMKAIDRPRPPRTWWRSSPDGASFPSRHATSAALGLLVVRDQLPDSSALSFGVVALVTVECYSRVRLGVHWPTDVAAGALLGVCVHHLFATRHHSSRQLPGPGMRRHHSRVRLPGTKGLS